MQKYKKKEKITICEKLKKNKKLSILGLFLLVS